MDLSLSQKRMRETTLLLEIENRLDQERCALVVIDGDCGAGKTTLANEIVTHLFQGTVIPMDHFFLPANLRSEERLQAPGGNIHFERFREEILEVLLAGTPSGIPPTASSPGKEPWKPFRYGQYDCRSGRMIPRRVIPRPLVIIEGSYSLHPAFSGGYKALHALRVFLSVSPGEQQRRLQKRDPALWERFRQEWIPLEKAYAIAYHVKSSADISLCTDEWVDENTGRICPEAVGRSARKHHAGK